ncbi:MAG: LytTR family DNA-binding domain-containing protein [Bacteroidota bacterium]
MTNIKTILVDDEPRGLTSLQKMLGLHCPDLEIIALCENADEARNNIMQYKPALVFLDIAMPGKNGFDLLEELPSIDFEIVFTTAHNTYMQQAFHFSAMDYLLKPVDTDLLIAATDRVIKRLANKNGRQPVETFLHNGRHGDSNSKKKLCIPSLKGFQVVDMADIIYCEAAGNYTNFIIAGKLPVICASRPIHEYDALLDDSGFIRVHKSYLINMGHIREYQRGEGGSVVLSNGFAAEVSRRKKDEFIAKMKEFFKY